jgi:RNA polymerase sigma-70 factor (ECF subfamily)
VNISLNLIRGRKRSNFTEEVEELEDASTAEETRGQREVRQRLRTAMAELHPKAAEILVLRYVHGYTDAEIARLLGTSRGTVAVSLFRSRLRLRTSIRKMGEHNETT